MSDDVLVEGAPVVLVGEPAGVLAFSTATPALRPRWFDGRLLAPEVLAIEQRYRRLLAAASAGAGGAGVVVGLIVGTAGAPGAESFLVSGGLAVTASGRVLALAQSISVTLASLLPGAGPGTPTQLFVLALAPDDQPLAAAAAGSPSRVAEGAVLRAHPYAWRLPPASKGAALDPALHLRSLAASDYLRASRAEQPALTSGKGLRGNGWCRGARAAVGDEVPLALVAVADGRVVFVDRWAARRERIIEPPARRAAFAGAMRPTELFLAEVLQFQCQLASGEEVVASPPGAPAPGSPASGPGCLSLHAVLAEAHAAFTELTRTDFSPVLAMARTADAVSELRSEPASRPQQLALPGGYTALYAITQRLGDKLAPAPQVPGSLLVAHGFVELPPAGYLPVAATPSVNQQARALFGPGVDVRVCAAHADVLAHALEEAQHMERISLVAGLADPALRPEVDVLVPDGVPRTGPPPQGAYAMQVRLGADRQSPGQVRGALRLDQRPGGGLTARAAAFGIGQRLIFDVVSLLSGRTSAWQALRQRRRVPEGLAFAKAEEWTSGGRLDIEAQKLDERLREAHGIYFTLDIDRDPSALAAGQIAKLSARVLLAAAGDTAGALDLKVDAAFRASRLVGQGGGDVIGVLDLRLTVSRLRAQRNDPAERLFTRRRLLQARAHARPAGLALRIADPKTATVVSVELTRAEAGRVSGVIGLGPSPIDARDPADLVTPLVRLDAVEDPAVLDPANLAHRQAELGLRIVAATTPAGAALEDEARKALFEPRPLSDELIVDATRNYVLFHRRRARRCVTLPVPASQRAQLMRVLAASATSADEAAALALAIESAAPAEVAALRARLGLTGGGPAPVVFEFAPRAPRPVEAAGVVTDGLRTLALDGPVHAALVAGAGAPGLELARATALLAALPPETPPRTGLTVRPLPTVPAGAASFEATAVLVLVTVPAPPPPPPVD